MSDAFDEMKKMKNGGYSTDIHSEETTEKFVYHYEDGNIIKNFVLNWGRKIVDFLSWLGVFVAILAFILFFAFFIKSLSYRYDETAPYILFVCMIFVPLIILLITIISNYFIYLLIDIRDSLKEINSNLPLKK